MHDTIVLLCLLVIAFTFGDVFSTGRALQKSNAHEGNPVIRMVMNAVGGKWIIVRFIATMLVIYVALHPKTDQSWALGLLVADLALLCYVVLSNLRLGKQIDF